MGGGNGYNVLGGRQALIYDIGWLKLKGRESTSSKNPSGSGVPKSPAGTVQAAASSSS